MLNKWTGTEHAPLAKAVGELERDKSELLSLSSVNLWPHLERMVCRDMVRPEENMVYAPSDPNA